MKKSRAALGVLAAWGLAAGLVTAAQVTLAAPASAVSGLVKVRAISAIDSTSARTATAVCPAGKRVLSGGGGLVWQGGGVPNVHEVVLTAMWPVDPLIGEDRFVVTAHETTTGTALDWWLDAYAMCADPMPGWHIVFTTTSYSSSSVRLAQPACHSGERVMGTGGWVTDTAGQVGIQVLRASTLGTFAYFQAHEDADGYSASWSALGFAVCVDTPPGYQVVQAPSAYSDSQWEKEAAAVCPSTKRMHGAGAAIAFNAPGNVSLSRILPDPYSTGLQVNAVAIENVATSADWDFIVAQAICAT